MIGAHRSEAGQAARETERPNRDEAEAGGSSSNELHSIASPTRFRPGRRQRKRSPQRKRQVAVIRESGGPKGTRVVGRLQKSGRRIFDVVATHAERRAGRLQVSLMRRPFPDEEGRFAVGEKGAGRARANVTGSACESASAARSEIEPAEGVLVRLSSSS